MLNLNEEYTYYKDKHFINYCLGCFRYRDDHDNFGEMQCYHSGKWGMVRFTIDYGREDERKTLCKLIMRHIKDDERAYRIFRCDFDFGMNPGEQETADNDFREILTLFDAYCREQDTEGFVFTHFHQKHEEDPSLLLTKHVHIVYREPFAGPSFSEFVHKHI